MKSYPTPVKFIPTNKNKYIGDLSNIVMRSSWESKLATFFDKNENILKWGSETKPIPYYSNADGRMRRYFPDFYVTLIDKDGKTRKMIIEIKPLSQTIKPKTYRRSKKTVLRETIDYVRNQDKWEAAKAYASKIGWEFMVMTEKELRYKIEERYENKKSANSRV